MNKAVEKWFVGALAVVMFVVFVGMAKNFDTATGKNLASATQTSTTLGSSQDNPSGSESNSTTKATTEPAVGTSRSSNYSNDDDDDDDDRKTTYSPSPTIQKTPSTTSTSPRQQRPLTRSRAS